MTHTIGRRVLVLLTDAFGGHGGIAAYNRDVLAAFDADPSIAKVVAMPRIANKPIGSVPAKVVFELGGLGGSARYLRAAARLMIRGGGFDMIYCAHMRLLPLARVIAAWKRSPLVLAIYGIDAWSPLAGRLGILARPRADRVLSISQITLDRFLGWSKISPEICSLLPNAIHLDAFGIAPRNPILERRYGLEGKKVILTLGRLAGSERYKGFDEVLEALPTIISSRPDCMYVIAGSGEDRNRLEGKAAMMGLSRHVVFTGAVPESEKADIYRLADVYAMPSRGEGFGFVFLEAMACGIPVIASSADGGREAVKNGELGLLVDPDDRGALVAAVLEAIDQPKCIPQGLEYFAFPRFANRLSAAISEVVCERPSP